MPFYSAGFINFSEKTISQIINENIGNNEKVYIQGFFVTEFRESLKKVTEDCEKFLSS